MRGSVRCSTVWLPGSLERVRKVIAKVNPGVIKAVYVNNAESADQIAGLARNWVKVGSSGKLKGSIKVSGPGETPPKFSQGLGRRGRSRNTTALGEGDYVVSVGNSGVRYAHLVEFGAAPHEAGGMFDGAEHPGAPAQPFFWPAVRTTLRTHKRRMLAKVKKAVEQAKRS